MPPESAPRSFADDCRATAAELRAALAAVYADVGADAGRPQVVARRFRLNKNLTWKIAKVLQSTDPLETVPLVPGSEGMGLIVGAMLQAGASPAVIARLRSAMADFERMIELHVGDRQTLEILMDGLGQGRSIEMSRKIAFRGNSGVWGLQARLRTMAAVLAPNPQRPEFLDMALMAGMFGIRRLRPVQGWPIFRFRHDLSPPKEGARVREIEPLEAPRTPEDPLFIMRSWCVPNDAGVRSVQIGNEVVHELQEGPVGRTGEVTLVFGHHERSAVPRYGGAPGEMGELSALVSIPVETLVQDVLLHRDIADDFEPEVRVYGRPFGMTALDPRTRENYRLPITERLERLGPIPESLWTEHMPRHVELMQSIFERCGWNPKDFVGVRLQLQYPPMPSTAIIRYRLPIRA